jgi:hypothetical protein
MRSEKELFDLARLMFHINLDLNKETINSFEREELKEKANEIRNTILVKGYDVNEFMRYQELYGKMSIPEYFKFLKTLE